MQKITKIILTAAFIVSISALSTVTFAQFPFNLGGPGPGGSPLNNDGGSIATDVNNNVYVTGNLTSNPCDFDPSAGTANLVAQTFNNGNIPDAFIAKYSSVGAYQWAFFVGSGNRSDAAVGHNNIAIDASGNIYTIGIFFSSADFSGTSTVGTKILTSNGNGDYYIAKYNTNGAIQWAFNMGSTASESGIPSLAIDPSGNIVVSGTFAGTGGDVSGTSIPGTATLGAGGFLAKYNGSSGAYMWAITKSGINSVTTDALGNILVTGISGLVAKYDGSGVSQWAFNITNGTGNSIVTDASGNAMITGSVVGTASFPNGGGSLKSAGSTDIFVAKYDGSGNCSWAFLVGGSGADVAEAITADVSGNIFITGYFTGTVDFDPLAGTHTPSSSITTAQDYSIFVAQYNSSGIYNWAFSIKGGGSQGGVGSEVGTGIAADAGGNVALTGTFWTGPINFNPLGTTKNLTSKSSGGIVDKDVFVSRYNNSGVLSNVGCSAHAGSNQSICQGLNNSVTIGAASTSGHTYSWSPSTGLSSATVSQPTATPTLATTYTLTETVTASGCTATGKVVVFNSVQPPVPAITPSGDTVFCIGGSVVLDAGSGYAAYLWSNGGNTQTINVSTQESYSVTVSSSPGCSSVSAVTNVTVNPLPAANAGSSQVICPGIAVTIGAATVSGDAYSWSPATGLNSATVSQPTASPTIITTYTLTETVTATGCHATHTVLVALKAAAATPVITPSGPTTFCTGGSVTLNSGSGYATYLWSDGESTQSIDVNMQGNYSVTVTNVSSCSSASSATGVTVNPIPATPVISQKGDTLFCSILADSYQWYRHDTLINSATGNYYIAPIKGSYTVTIVQGGCSATSASFNYNGTGINSVVPANAQVFIYPTPASAYFIAESKTDPLQSVSLYDILGKRILSAGISDVNMGTDNRKAKINIQELTPGVYFVQLKTNNAVTTLRVVKE